MDVRIFDIHCTIDVSLYILQMSNDKEVAVLREAMEAVAFNTGNSLKDQQLTHEGIPVIVDKCIRFVYSHGCMTEGKFQTETCWSQ